MCVHRQSVSEPPGWVPGIVSVPCVGSKDCIRAPWVGSKDCIRAPWVGSRDCVSPLCRFQGLCQRPWGGSKDCVRVPGCVPRIVSESLGGFQGLCQSTMGRFQGLCQESPGWVPRVVSEPHGWVPRVVSESHGWVPRVVSESPGLPVDGEWHWLMHNGNKGLSNLGVTLASYLVKYSAFYIDAKGPSKNVKHFHVYKHAVGKESRGLLQKIVYSCTLSTY